MLGAEVVDPLILCTQKNASVSGNFGPFGLLVLASKDLSEHTAVFFRVFRSDNNFRVLMCADQSRLDLSYNRLSWLGGLGNSPVKICIFVRTCSGWVNPLIDLVPKNKK